MILDRPVIYLEFLFLRKGAITDVAISPLTGM